MPGALTVRTIPPGGSYFCSRRKRVIHVPKTHYAIVCMDRDCEYSLHYPTRLIKDLEEMRVRHIQTVHFPDLLKGIFTINLEEVWEEFEKRVAHITEPLIRR